MKNTASIGLACAAAATLLLSGCAGPSDAVASGSSTDAASATGVTDVTIGVLPGADLAPLYLGLKQGFFADEGINLTINSYASSSAAVLAAVSEEKYDFGYADILSILVAQEQGFGVDIVSGAAASSGVVLGDYAALIVRADSDIATIDDLANHSVAVDAIGTTNDLVVRNAIDKGDADSSAIDWQAIPFIGAAKAVADGSVDAALVVEPFATAAKIDGMRVLSYPYAEFDTDLTVSAYFTASTLSEENPDLAARFLAAITESIAYAAEAQTETRDTIASSIDAESQVRTRVTLPKFTASINRDATTRLIDAAVEYGLLSVQPDLDAILP